MVLSLIDQAPMNPGWGQIWQSGALASLDWDEKGLTVSMSGNENFEGPCLWVSIPDNDSYTLPDAMLLAFTGAILSFLKKGQNILIHCNEGKHRSTYMDVAVHMRAGMTFVMAYALVKGRHPIANLRTGTAAQLIRMEPMLKGA